MFFELFKLTQPLAVEINYNKAKIGIGGGYVSITYRFQQLLGDFKESNYEVLSESERNKIIERCLDFIKKIKQKHQYVEKILITSDSQTFLQKAKERYEYVYTIHGKVYHVDYTNNKDNFAYMKSFVDLFMLSEAEFVYNYVTGQMYPSGFPSIAAKIGNKPFCRVIE